MAEFDMEDVIANLRNEKHSLAGVLMNSSAPEYIFLVLLFFHRAMMKSTQSVPVVAHLSNLHGNPHFVILLRTLTHQWCPIFHTCGDWYQVRIYSALEVESLKYVLERGRAGGEGTRQGWVKQWTPDRIRWATGIHWKVSCEYLTHPPEHRQCSSQQNREQRGWEGDINGI